MTDLLVSSANSMLESDGTERDRTHGDWSFHEWRRTADPGEIRHGKMGQRRDIISAGIRRSLHLIRRIGRSAAHAELAGHHFSPTSQADMLTPSEPG
jgi:hypothetical protein